MTIIVPTISSIIAPGTFQICSIVASSIFSPWSCEPVRLRSQSATAQDPACAPAALQP